MDSGAVDAQGAMKARAPLALSSAIIALFLYVPLIVVGVYSFNAAKHSETWTGFSLNWYRSLPTNEVALAAVKNSLTLAICSAAISTFLGTMLGYGMYRGSNKRLASFLHLPICLPDIVQAVALLLFLSVLHNWLGILGLGMSAMILGHVTFQIPFVAVVVRARCATLDRSWEEAARDLGATPAQTFWHVTLPMLRPGIFAAAMLAFTLSLDDFVVSFFTGGAGSTTLPVYIYSSVKRGISPEINALSTLLIGAAVAATTVVTLIQKSPTIPMDEPESPARNIE
jgi:spermidine/putrescine transport system permease protein